jgi:hypothetical protein
MKRGKDYYKNLLTRQALLLEQHPCGSGAERSSARKIRQALKEDRPVAQLRACSNIAELMLESLNLAARRPVGNR